MMDFHEQYELATTPKDGGETIAGDGWTAVETATYDMAADYPENRAFAVYYDGVEAHTFIAVNMKTLAMFGRTVADQINLHTVLV